MNKLYERYKDCDQLELNNELLRANLSGRLDIIEYVTSSPELSVHANIHFDDEIVLRRACAYGNLHIVKYLLTSPLLKLHADIDAYYGESLLNACEQGNFDVADYLLKSPELNKHANVHIDNDTIFKSLCEIEKSDGLKYLILDYGLDKTDKIEEFLNINADKLVGAKLAKEMFEKRDLANLLDKELEPNKNSKPRKPKL
jgi:hypothetical protein